MSELQRALLRACQDETFKLRADKYAQITALANLITNAKDACPSMGHDDNNGANLTPHSNAILRYILKKKLVQVRLFYKLVYF